MSAAHKAQILALVIAGLIGSGVYAARVVRATEPKLSSAQEQLIPQPDGWQPFSATLTQASPDYPGLEMVGFFSRSSDGSQRIDQSTLDRRTIGVTILNNKTGWQYVCNIVRNVCARSPLAPRRVLKVRASTPYMEPLTQKIEGFAIYRYTPPTGEVRLQAPALNFADLERYDPKKKLRTVLSNIRLGEPAPALFELPAGARVVDAGAH